jgi:hypothetical protein
VHANDQNDSTSKPVRLWTIHPSYLDSRGLVALWREALLAQKVLEGQTRGYRRHPQLDRFAGRSDRIALIGAYLVGVEAEARRRGYLFDRSKIVQPWEPPLESIPPIAASTGQVLYEWQHLLGKLTLRAPSLAANFRDVALPDLHPIFRLVEGPRADWERG